MNLTQLIWTKHNICNVRGSNLGHQKQKIITPSVSQYLSLLNKLHIPRNQINFVIFDEIICVFSIIPLPIYYFILLFLATINM